MEKTDLAFVPTEELVNELIDRHDTAIFVGRKKQTKFKEHLTRVCCGDKLQVLGLVEILNEKITREVLDMYDDE
jgi:hypothetical protein